MAEFKVVVSDYILPDLEIEREAVEAVGAELVVGQSESVAGLIELAHDADAMFNTYFGPISDEVYEGCPRLKVVVRFGIGYDTIDVEAATRHGIMVVNVPDYCIEEVSDHAIGLWLALGRKIVSADRTVRTGEWGMEPLQPVLKLQGQTVGIVGLGRIGRRTAQKLGGFGVKLLFADPYVDAAPDLGVDIDKVELDELCLRSDAITLHALSNEETHHLINTECFGLMKQSPILVNTARARLIDTDALVNALEKGQIRGAGLDLVEGEELAADHPLMQMDQVVITPHVAWYSEASIVELRRKAAQEVVRVLQGGKPVNLLNPGVEPR